MDGNRARLLRAVLGLALLVLGGWVLVRSLRGARLGDILSALGAIPAVHLLGSALLVAVAYLILATYDLMALRFIDVGLPLGRTVLASFVGYVFSHNLSFSVLSGGGVRLRLYSHWGLTGMQVAQVVTFTHLTFYVGLITAGGLTFLLGPPEAPGWFPGWMQDLRPIGAMLLVVVMGYLGFAILQDRPLRFGRLEVPTPTPRYAAGQMALGTVEWIVAATSFYLLLPPAPGLTLASFLGIYLVGTIVGQASHVPGSLGVLEGVMVLLLEPFVGAHEVFGALVAFRMLYYLLPLGLALALLAVWEATGRKVAPGAAS